MRHDIVQNLSSSSLSRCIGPGLFLHSDQATVLLSPQSLAESTHTRSTQLIQLGWAAGDISSRVALGFQKK